MLGILYRLEKFHHYSFAREVSIITGHKPLVAISKKILQIITGTIMKIYSEYINTGLESHTSLNQIFSWQTGCPDKHHKENRHRNTWNTVKYLWHTNNY